MEKKLENLPIIFIIGTTAVGKTKLSLELAKELKAQLISADSMQVYKYANILTAKVTKEEQSIAKHHMIDIIDIND